MTKRLFDIVFASLGLLVLSPLGLLIAACIKLADRGPMFYGQIRVGQFGKSFRIWKFRSMVRDADKLGAVVTQEGDPRVTWIGRILRRAKLDELPQLWNVLVGDMSFVGPRPEVPRYVELYSPEQREILQYKPGITDIATLLFRNEEALLRGTEDLEAFYLRYCLPKKIELNLQYERRATLVQDIWIILQTLCPYWLGVILVYLAALVCSFWLAFLLRSDFELSSEDWQQFMRFLPVAVLPQLLFLVWRGELRGLLSYFSIPEMSRTVSALGLALLAQLGLCAAWQRYPAPRFSILLMDFILSFFALSAVRMAFRLWRERLAWAATGRVVRPWRVAIVGTGELATNLVLDFRRHRLAREVVAFFDDNPRTWHKRPYDIPVVGMPECLLNREWAGKIDEVILTLSENDANRTREICELLKASPMKVTIASGWPALSRLNAQPGI